MGIKINPPSRSYTSLYGVWGIFKVPNSKMTIKYFSSKVHKKDPSSARILSELKPMRERVKPKDLKDMKSLLQRDLDDKRIATELIPYLQGKKSIAFFPNVLAVISPKDFFILDKNTPYPKFETKENDDRQITSYEGDWVLEILKDGDGLTSIAELRIDLSTSVIIVLDGQHRANSFRFVSGDFNNESNRMYANYYSDLSPIENYQAELPITFIWFESDNQRDINANIISRELFIDVNNNAKAISRAREILLDDKDPVAVLTGYFYSYLAKEKGFIYGQLSVIHSDFDIPEDRPYSKMNVLSLTSPEIIYDLLEKNFFCDKENYNNLGKYSATGNKRTIQLDTISKFMPNFHKRIRLDSLNDSYVEEISFNGKDKDDINAFKEEFEGSILLIIYRVLNEIVLSKLHLNVSDEINSLYNSEEVTQTKLDIWNDVFCGGEGLYYSFTSYAVNNDKIKKVNKVITEVETDFNSLKQKKIGILHSDIQKAYKTFRSKAFQTGLISAFLKYFDLFSSEGDVKKLNDALDRFLSKLNEKTIVNWIHILTKLKKEVTKSEGLDPKKWPAMQKIILRVLNEPNHFYNRKENLMFSPDVVCFKNHFLENLKHLSKNGVKVDDTVHLSKSTLDGWKDSILNDMAALLDQCGLIPLDGINWDKVITDCLYTFKKKSKTKLGLSNDEEKKETTTQ